MADKVTAARPDPRDNSQRADGAKGPSVADVNADLARVRFGEKFMDRSGTLAISSKIQIADISVLMAARDLGIQLDPVIAVFENYEHRSPNLDGIGRSQTIQIGTAPTVLIPGVGRMENAYPENPGFWARAGAFLFGGDKSTSQTSTGQAKQ